METTDVCAHNGRQRNGTALCLLTNPAFAFNITMVGIEFGDTVGKAIKLLVMHRHTGSAPDIMVAVVLVFTGAHL
ncbi:hypothetical protein TNCV_4168601 [Trichonephila clavipes]|nr:hypothetical protein TNCV_4168601 [Trichonephila clavipes]